MPILPLDRNPRASHHFFVMCSYASQVDVRNIGNLEAGDGENGLVSSLWCPKTWPLLTVQELPRRRPCYGGMACLLSCRSSVARKSVPFPKRLLYAGDSQAHCSRIMLLGSYCGSLEVPSPRYSNSISRSITRRHGS